MLAGCICRKYIERYGDLEYQLTVSNRKFTTAALQLLSRIHANVLVEQLKISHCIACSIIQCLVKNLLSNDLDFYTRG